MYRKFAKPAAVALLVSGGAIALSSFHTQAAPAAPAAIPLTGKWVFDPAHSSVNFSIKHFGISEVHGHFDTFSGTIVADAAHPSKSSVDVTINAASLDTGLGPRDADVKGKNYLDTDTYPTITYKSTSVKKTGKGSYLAEGFLTIHGVSKVVALPFTLAGPILDPFGGTRIGIVTSTTIDRVAYGVGGNGKLADGSFAIGTDVPIDISVEATPAK